MFLSAGDKVGGERLLPAQADDAGRAAARAARDARRRRRRVLPGKQEEMLISDWPIWGPIRVRVTKPLTRILDAFMSVRQVNV